MVSSLWEVVAVVSDGCSGWRTVAGLLLGETTLWLWNEPMLAGLTMKERCFSKPYCLCSRQKLRC